jgi:hypothetical protein
MSLFTYFAQVGPNDFNVPHTDVSPHTVSNVLELVFGVAGIVAVLIIVIAGMRYSISQGDPQATAKAKNTIIYAVIGLVIAISAFAIVGFVLGSV